MSDAAVTILVTGLVQIVATIAGVLVLWIKARDAAQNSATAARTATEAKEAARKAAGVGERTAEVVEVIHEATNSGRTLMESRMAEQDRQLDALRRRVEELHAEALAREQRLPPIQPPA